MTTSFSIHLYQIASIAQQENALSRNWSQPLTPQMLGLNIYRLAMHVRGVESVDDDQVLPTFFSDDAIAILFTMPNLHWFWKMVAHSALAADDHAAVIGAATVKDALRHFRNELGMAFDLTRRIDQLTVQEACVLVAAGIIVLRPEGLLARNAVPVFNPVVQPQG
jgi:hypothetical protein